MGDKVFADAAMLGSFAEYVACPETNVVPMPANMNYLQAAVTPLAALTALQALKNFCFVKEGTKVSVYTLLIYDVICVYVDFDAV